LKQRAAAADGHPRGCAKAPAIPHDHASQVENMRRNAQQADDIGVVAFGGNLMAIPVYRSCPSPRIAGLAQR